MVMSVLLSNNVGLSVCTKRVLANFRRHFSEGIKYLFDKSNIVDHMDVTIRDVDEAVFRRFKGKAAERGIRMGEAATRAMQLFIVKDAKRPAGRGDTIRLSELTKRESDEEIDSLLYGK